MSGNLLTEQQKRIIVGNTELSMSEAGVITTTEGVVLSEGKATASTFSLSSAFKGLAASLGITTTALGVITGALAAVSVGAIAYKKWAEYQEELRQSAVDASNALIEQSKSVDVYVERYQELQTALKNAKGDEQAVYSIKQDLLTLQNELNDTFGEEYGKLNLVTDAYKDQTEAIKQYNKELAQSYLNENESAINTAKSKMEGNNHYNLTYTGEILNSDRGAILKEIAEQYKDRGVSILDELGDGSYTQFSIHLNANAEDAQDVINDFMNDVREKAIELNDEDLFADVLEISSSSLNKSKDIIDEYGDIYKKALLSEIATNDGLSTGYNQITQAVESYNEAILKSEDPYNDDDVKNAWNNLQTIKQGIEENVDVWGKYESVTTEAFEQANDSAYSFYQTIQNDDSISKLTNDLRGLSNTDLESMASDGVEDSFDKLCNAASDYGLEIQDVIDLLIKLGIIQGQIASETLNPDEMSVLFPEFDPITFSDTIDRFSEITSAYENFVDKVNNKEKLVFDISDIEKMRKALVETTGEDAQLGVTKEQFDKFEQIMTSGTASAYEMKNALQTLSTEYIYATGVLDTLSEENRDQIVTQYELQGVTNISSIATKELAQGLDDVRNSGTSAQQVLNGDMSAFENIKFSSTEAGEAVAQYMLAKITANGVVLNTDADINNLISLISYLGGATDALETFAAMKNGQYTNGNKINRVGNSGDYYRDKIQDEIKADVEATKAKNKLANSIANLNDVRNGSKGSSSKETEKEIDVLSELNSELDEIQKGYEAIKDARETYNEYGKISVDQAQELINTDLRLLATMGDEENACRSLANAKLEEMKIQMARNALDTLNSLKTEADAVEYLAMANANLRNQTLSANEALLQQAVLQKQSMGGAMSDAASTIWQGYQNAISMIGNVDFSFNKDDIEKDKKDEKDEKTILDFFNEERRYLEHLQKMGKIDNKEFYDRLMKLADTYLSGNDEYKEEYWGVQEEVYDYFESIKETYNWIDTFLETLSKKTNSLIDKVSKFITWSKKNAMINRAVKSTNTEIQAQTNAYAYYAEKARKVGLSYDYISKIQNGSLSMEDMYNESLSGKIEEYQEWYDKMVSCQDAINELYDQERNLIKQKLDNVLDYYKDIDSYLSSITSRFDSFINLQDEMGKRSSLSELVEQFATINDQIAKASAVVADITTAKETVVTDNTISFGDSQKVKESVEKANKDAIKELNNQKTQALLGVQNTGTYKKLLNEIAKAEAAYDKQYEILMSIDPEKDKNGKKEAAAQKKLDSLGAKLDALVNKKDDLEQNAIANNVVAYAKLYDQYMKLYNKREALEEKGKELSQKDSDRMDDLFDQMVEMSNQRESLIKELDRQIGLINGDVSQESEIERLSKELQNVNNGVKNSATYQSIEKDIDSVQAKIDKFWDTHDSATTAQQKQLDKWEKQLDAYYEKQRQLEENATKDTVAEYAKVYDAWRKLQDKLDAGKTLSVSEYKKYNQYNEQLQQFANERSSIVQSLNDQLEKAINPGDKIENIKREYEEAAKGIYDSYQSQINNINAQLTSSTQYKDLLAKKQNLENIRDTKGLSASQENNLKKYTAELEALEKGATGNNIKQYMQIWEKWYALQSKLDSGKTLSKTEATNYDKWKSQLDEWNNEKQTQISDLVNLMNEDLKKLSETNTENIAEAESEINNYYADLYSLAKQIAEYNLSNLETQLTLLESYLGYYKEIVSLYDNFSGDKLNSLLTDLGIDVLDSQEDLYNQYLSKLQDKYDTTLSKINEYKQLIDAIDTNDFAASMDLFKSAIADYKATGQDELASKLQSVLDLLNERSIDADNWGEYADEWLNEWQQALAETKTELINTATSIQEVNDALREINFLNITNAVKELSNAQDILSSITGLINDDWLYDEDGNLTKYGITKVGLLVEQIEQAKQEVNKYAELVESINNMKDTYASESAYQDALQEAKMNYFGSLSELQNYQDSVVSILTKADDEIISSLRDVIEKRKEALKKKKELYDYNKTIQTSQKEIDSIKAQIDALESLSGATDAATKAKLAQLKADLAEKEDALQETKDEHTYNLQIDALDEFLNTLDSTMTGVADSVNKSFETYVQAINSAMDIYNKNKDYLSEWSNSVIDTTLRLGGINSDSNTDLGLAIGDGSTSETETAAPSLNITNSDAVTAIEETSSKTQDTILSIKEAIDKGLLIKVDVDSPLLKLNSEMTDFVKNYIPPMAMNVNTTIPNLIKERNIQPVINVHYDNLLNVEGSIDKDFAKVLPKHLEEAYSYMAKRLYQEINILK